MTKESYVILVSSQKGGVGKTTVAINLATALKYNKYNVLLIDTDASTCSVTEHLMMATIGENDYQKAIHGEIEAKDAIVPYQPLDLHLMLGDLDRKRPESEKEEIGRFYGQILKMGYDFVVIDSSPGFFNELLAKYIDDVIIVTTPDSVSVRSSSKLSAYCEKLGLKHRLVLSRSGLSSKYEMETDAIEKLYGDLVATRVPEDQIVQESLYKHKPAYMIDRNSSFSLAIDELSRVYMLRAGGPQNSGTAPSADRNKTSFFGRLGDILLKA